eukprot:7380154-Prymnesium_polylepis.3
MDAAAAFADGSGRKEWHRRERGGQAHPCLEAAASLYSAGLPDEGLEGRMRAGGAVRPGRRLLDCNRDAHPSPRHANWR